MGEALQSAQANADVISTGKPQAAASDTSSTASSTHIHTDEDSSGIPTVTVCDGKMDCLNQEAASVACREAVKRAIDDASGRDQEDVDHHEEDCSSQNIVSTTHRQAAADGMNHAEGDREEVDHNEGRQMEPV